MKSWCALVVLSLLSLSAFADEDVYFNLVDPAGVDLETAAVCATGDVKISVDNGSWSNTTNCFTEVPNSAGDQGRYKLTLTTAELQGKQISISIIDQTATKVWLDENFGWDEGFRRGQDVMIPCSVETSAFAATTTEFESDSTTGCTEATADHYNGRIVLFTSGALAGQAATILDYSLSASFGHFTVSTLTEAPVDEGHFVILPHHEALLPVVAERGNPFLMLFLIALVFALAGWLSYREMRR